jgi:hypothetical protein
VSFTRVGLLPAGQAHAASLKDLGAKAMTDSTRLK